MIREFDDDRKVLIYRKLLTRFGNFVAKRRYDVCALTDKDVSVTVNSEKLGIKTRRRRDRARARVPPRDDRRPRP